LEKNDLMTSLLPYLDPLQGKFYLKFSLITQETELLEKTPFPFLVINDTDPLASLIEARFVTDTGSELKRAFIMTQRDQYLLSRDELWPLTNLDIETSWQNAFSSYAGGKHDHSLITLENQISENGRLALLPSLFFCKARQIFFHPPCPKCGLLLHQCEDDGFLISSGLQPYSGSLKRYLFCPSCASSGNVDFYVYELEHSDPPFLKDRRALLREFSLLHENKGPASQFPCGECPKYKECYGTGKAVLSRIVPFSFYPFYMLVFEAMSLCAPDFLSLISGATFEELESRLKTRGELGRMRCLETMRQDGSIMTPFLYHGSEEFFLEVLYLKLSFLGEVLQSLFSDTDLFKHPDLRLSIDRIWIKIADHGALLPFFWNFTVKYMDISRPSTGSEFHQKLPSPSSLYFLGLIWFYALLANKKQDISMISNSLREAVDSSISPGDFSSKNYFKEGVSTTFSPENMFWQPDGKTVDASWHSLWGISLGLGWSLLRAGLQQNPQWSKEEFWQQFQNLRAEVAGNLFQKEPVALDRTLPSERIHPSEDEAIHDILVRIMNRWHSRGEEAEEILKETIVVSPEGLKGEPFPPTEEEEQATIILSPEGLKEKTIPSPVREEEVSEETVILFPEGLKEKPVPPPPKEKEVEEAIPETVIISHQGTEKYPPSFAQGVKAEDLGPEEKALSPEEAEKLEAMKKKIKKPEDEDFLAETVILRPKKVQDKDKKEKDD
jgi:hypothetical protein